MCHTIKLLDQTARGVGLSPTHHYSFPCILGCLQKNIHYFHYSINTFRSLLLISTANFEHLCKYYTLEFHMCHTIKLLDQTARGVGLSPTHHYSFPCILGCLQKNIHYFHYSINTFRSLLLISTANFEHLCKYYTLEFHMCHTIKLLDRTARGVGLSPNRRYSFPCILGCLQKNIHYFHYSINAFRNLLLISTASFEHLCKY